MIRLYISAPFELQEDGQRVRKLLTSMGYGVTSTWLDEPPTNTMQNVLPDRLRVMGNRDKDDICRADGLVLINPEMFRRTGTGGRHYECGYAAALEMPISILGVPTNVFHYDDSVKVVAPNLSLFAQSLDIYWNAHAR